MLLHILLVAVTVALPNLQLLLLSLLFVLLKRVLKLSFRVRGLGGELATMEA